jgi:hypothetical protein
MPPASRPEIGARTFNERPADLALIQQVSPHGELKKGAKLMFWEVASAAYRGYARFQPGDYHRRRIGARVRW